MRRRADRLRDLRCLGCVERMTKTIAEYGSWGAGIGADLVAGQSLRFGLVQTVGGRIFWSEMRPSEQGRSVIVERAEDGNLADLTPAPYSARSRVHEYGGGEFLATARGVFFVNAADQDLYVVKNGGPPRRITDEPAMRFADMTYDRARDRLIAVAERHTEGEQHSSPENYLVTVKLDESDFGAVSKLAGGADFYAYPRIDGTGGRLCWIEWMLPWMPWEDARLVVAELDGAGEISSSDRAAGGAGDHVFQPQWADDGRLYFVLDNTGWSNIFRLDDGKVRCVAKRDAEFGRPLWGLGASSYAVERGGTLIAACIEEGAYKLVRISPDTGACEEIETPLRQIDGICTTDRGVAAVAAGDELAPAIVHIGRGEKAPAAPEILRRGLDADLESGSVSAGQLITLERGEGICVSALYYAPANARFAGPSDAAPPVIVGAHGGPTGMADRGLKLKIQYWTSRGFGYLDVDYRGSSGYGRAYRNALNGQWGLHDVDDVVDMAARLVELELADPDRLLISGGSAGGFTVLCALTFRDVFAAGASYYGIGDLQKLLDLTHKFEAGYIYNLTGTSPGNTERVFAARSPLFHAEQISRPVILFQGLEDNVVPPNQSRDMVDTLKRQGVPVAYLEFEGEGHGFRQADTVVRALTSEYAFYARVLGLTPVDVLPRVKIFNEEEIP